MQVKELKLPWLDVHGDQDKLCEISGSQLLYEQSESEDKTFTVSITLPLFRVFVSSTNQLHLLSKETKGRIPPKNNKGESSVTFLKAPL